MNIRETYYISQEILSEFELVKAKTEKRHGFTSEATSQLVVERVIAGKQKVFRGTQKKPTSTEVYPAVILADWSFADTVRPYVFTFHDSLQCSFYKWLLQAGYQVYVWSCDGPILCSNIREIIDNLLHVPVEKINVIKRHCLKIIGDCTVLDFDKMELLTIKIRMSTVQSSTHADTLIDGNPKTLERLMNGSENLGLYLDDFRLSDEKARTLLNSYLREYGTDHLIVTKEKTLSLLIKHCELLKGNAGIKKLSIIIPPCYHQLKNHKNLGKILQYCQTTTELVHTRPYTLSIRFKIAQDLRISKLLWALSDYNVYYDETTTVTLQDFHSIQKSEPDTKKILEIWPDSRSPITLRSLRLTNCHLPTYRALFSIIHSCSNLGTLYLHDHSFFSNISDQDLNYYPKNKISKLIISRTQNSPGYQNETLSGETLTRFISRCPELTQLHISGVFFTWGDPDFKPIIGNQHLELCLRELGICQYSIEELLHHLPNIKGLELDYHTEFSPKFMANHVGYFKFLEYIRVFNMPADKRPSFIEQANILFPTATVDFCTEIGTSKLPMRYDMNFIVSTPDNAVYSDDTEQVSMVEVSKNAKRTQIEREQYTAPMSEVGIDINTENEKIDYQLHQHFLGPGAQRTTQYRLQVNLPPSNLFDDLENKIEPVPFSKINNAYAVFTKPQKNFLMSLVSMFNIFSRSKPSQTLYLGQVTLTLSHEWQSLPSLLPYESITHIECPTNIVLGKNAAKGLHYVKLSDQQSPLMTVTLRFVFQGLNHQTSKQFLLATRKQPLSEKEIDLVSGLALKENLTLVDNDAAKYFAKLSDQEKILTIRDYIDYFEPGETLGVDDSTPQHQRITAIFAQRKGACRHRASTGYSFLNALGIMTRNPVNAAHSFTEVYFQGTWCTLDLGGAPSGLTVVSKPFEGPLEANKVVHSDSDVDTESRAESEDSETELNALTSEAINAENKTTTGHITPTLLPSKWSLCPAEINTHHDYLQWLLQSTQCLLPGKTNHLIICPTTQDLQLLVYELQTLLTNNQCPSYFIENLDSVVCKGLKSDGQHYEIINSELVQFLQAPGVLLTDWTEYNQENIGYNSMYVDQPTLKGHPIALHTRKIALITEQGLAQYGDDFSSRFQFITQLPNLALQRKNSTGDEQLAPTKSISIALNNSGKWSEKLLGRLVFQDDKAIHKPGALEQLVEDESITDIELHNAPEDDDEFDAFYRQLTATNCFFANGAAYKFHNPMRFKLQQTQYDFSKLNVSFQRCDDIKSYAWDELLSPNTQESFFHTHRIENGMTKEQDGYLKQYSGKSLCVLVTQNLTAGSWMELLTEADEQQCLLHCLLAYGVSLPNELDCCATWRDHTPAHDRSENYHGHYSVDTDDSDYCASIIYQENPEKTVVLCLSEDLEASDLIGQTSVKEIAGKLHFWYQTGALISLLQQGKNIILKGRISESLADALATLWSTTPHLWCNGERFFPTSSCIIATENNPLRIYTNVRTLYSHKEAGQFEREQTVQRAKSFLTTSAVEQKMALLQATHLTFNDEGNPKDCDEFDRRRIAKVMAILKHQPCMFMLGKTGSGKSTLFRHFIKGFEGIENIVEWAKASSTDGNYIFLFIDEANMLSPQMLTALEGIFSPTPGLLYQGQWHPLSAQHKIIFAANPLSYGGRCQHKLWQNKVLAEIFAALPPWYVEHRVLTPLAKKLELNSSMIKQANSVFLSVYQLFYQDDIFTPRNCLQMMLNFYLAVNSSINLDNVTDVIRRCAFDEAFRVTRGLKNADQWMEQVITVLNDIPPQLQFVIDWNRYRDVLQQKSYCFYPEHQQTLETLHKHLTLRNLKVQTPSIADCGLSAMVIEGDSGIGKSTLAVNYLEFLGFTPAQRDTNNDHSQQKYYLLSSSDFDDVERLLTKAFHEGAIVIIDEVNTFNSSPEALVSIERLLNTFLSGTDLNGTKAHNPGFMLIGTQNPAGSYYGRAKETFAFANRLEKIWMPTMTTASLQATLMLKGCTQLLAKRLVLEYQHLRQNEINDNALLVRNPRDLFSEVSGRNPRIEQAKQFYRLFEVIAQLCCNHAEFDVQAFFGSIQQRLPEGSTCRRNLGILSYLFRCKQQINCKNSLQNPKNSVTLGQILNIR